MKSFPSLRNYDWLLVTVVFVLAAIGLSAIYSVDLSRGEELVFFPTQVIAFVIGVIVLFVAASIHMVVYQSYAWLVYIIGLCSLAGVLFFGVTIRGTTGWFSFAGFSFQPAELAKVALVLILGKLISRYGRRFDKPQFVVITGAVTILFAGLILLQPDLGSALVFFSVWFGILLLTGVKKRFILSLLIILAIGFISSWFFLFQEYQKNRFLTFIDPDRDPLGAGYNVTQSVIAIGSGQLAGRGLGFGSQSQLHFLPEAQTDFIFSVIAEELGFVGIFFVLSFFFFLLWRLIRIASMSRSEFGVYTVLGIVLLFFVQIIFNVGGAAGLLPITGLTLPFVSYGGSSLIVNCLLIGVALSINNSSGSMPASPKS
ncbi:MAG: rod shape-determining protein RodA [Patescibacteria group bacterium]